MKAQETTGMGVKIEGSPAFPSRSWEQHLSNDDFASQISHDRIRKQYQAVCGGCKSWHT
jgi:hypothetical protein